jgi:hypothetical protein
MLRQVLPRVKSRCKSAKRAVEKNSPSRASTVRERDQRRPHTHTAVRSNHAAADDIACTDQCTSAPQRKEDGSPPPMPMHVGVFIQADVIDLATAQHKANVRLTMNAGHPLSSADCGKSADTPFACPPGRPHRRLQPLPPTKQAAPHLRSRTAPWSGY